MIRCGMRAILTAVTLLASSGCSPSDIISTHELDDAYAEFVGIDWPFEHTEFTIECWRDRAITLRDQGDSRYALNGRARGQIEEKSWIDILDITLDDASGEPMFSEVDSVISYAVLACKY